jgi:DNA-binding MarR family transcriptional regulator
MAASTRGPGGEPDRDVVHAVIAQLVRFFVATDALNRTAAPRKIGLTPQQVQAAMQLMLRGELTVSELAAALGSSPSWASRLAEELVGSGHAIREQDPADRRIVRLRIAPGMREHCAQVYGERAAAIVRALAGASPAEIEALVRLMGRIATEFEALAARQAADAPPGHAAPDALGPLPAAAPLPPAPASL